MLKTEQILNAKFTPVSKGTYSAEEVDAFLKGVAESYDESLNQNRELMKKISILADKIESYRNDEEAIKLSLLDAHRMAETVNKNAQEKAEAKINDAESKSRIILDGANRQSSQMIEEAREKAKEIVDNARNAVASLTERAQTETEKAIVSAQNKAEEIVAAAKAEGESIIGTSKQSYEFYSAQLAKIKEETAAFKEAVKALCDGQLNLLDSVPAFEEETVNEVEVAEKIISELIAEEPAEVEAAEEEAPVIYQPEEAEEAEAEGFEAEIEEFEAEIEEELEEIEEAEDELEDAVEEIEEFEEIALEDIPEADDDDDLFSFIDDIELEDVSDDAIPASLDDLIPAAPVAFDEPAEEEAEEDDEDDDDDDDDDFDGFKIDLDSIDGLGSDDDDDDDITSLFDSLFDE